MAASPGVYIDTIQIGDTKHDLQDKRIPGIDSTPTANSTNLVTSGGVAAAMPDAVSANPTVPSGTTPTAMTGLKIGSSYYSVAVSASPMSNNDIDTAVNNAWV